MHDGPSEIWPRRDGFWTKWCVGVLIPLGLLAYGIVCIVTRQGMIFGDRTDMPVHDGNAIALGIASIGLGGFLHCICFLANIYDELVWATVGKVISLLTLIGGLLYLVINIMVYGHA